MNGLQSTGCRPVGAPGRRLCNAGKAQRVERPVSSRQHQTSQSGRTKPTRCSASATIGLLVAGALSQTANAAQTRTYVISWIVPALYSQEGDCHAIEPIAEPGRGAVDTLYRNILINGLGKSPEEADRLVQNLQNV